MHNKMKTLISESEKMLKKAEKKGEINVLNYSIFEEILDKVERDMEDYRIDNNYKSGLSVIDLDKVWVYQNKN